MATLLKKFGAHWMRNEEHFGFMMILFNLLSLLTIKGMEKAIALFTEKVKAEDAALEHQRKSERTAQVVELDVARGRAWRSLQLLAMSESLSDDQAVAAKADSLLGLIDHYGDPREMPYTQADGVFLNLTQDLADEPYATYVTDLNATLKVKSIVDKNKAFMDAYASRNAEQASIEAGIVRKARHEMDQAWLHFRNMLNSQVAFEGDEGAAQFIAEVNRQIDAQRTVRLNRATINAKKRENRENGEEKKN